MFTSLDIYISLNRKIDYRRIALIFGYVQNGKAYASAKVYIKTIKMGPMSQKIESSNSAKSASNLEKRL